MKTTRFGLGSIVCYSSLAGAIAAGEGDAPTITAGIVEDDEDYSRTLKKALLELPSVGKALVWETGESFLLAYGNSQSNPELSDLGILFLDMRLPGMNGLDVLACLSRDPPDFPVIVLSSVISSETIAKALSSGASGYIYKDEMGPIADIVDATLAGGAILTPTIAAKVIARMYASSSESPPEEQSTLTPREQDVLERLVSGLSERDTADTLGISLLTVRTHVKSIYRKLFVRNRASLLRRAQSLGLL